MKNPHQSEKSHRVKIRLWQFLGVVLLIYGADHMLSIVVLNVGQWDLPTRIIQGILAMVFWTVGVGSLNRARKLRSITVQALKKRDTRAPVLYLRSFHDDFKARKVVGSPLFSFLPQWVIGILTEEEQLSLIFNAIGPFIAIGKPGEKLPELGAIREYANEEEWKDWVSDEMGRAGLVVLRVGGTEGLLWEATTAIRTVTPQRLILLIPSDSERYKIFCEMTQQYFRKDLPRLEDSIVRDVASLNGIVYFEANGAAHLVELRAQRFLSMERFISVGRPLLPIFRNALRPVFQQLNVPLPDLKINWVLVTLKFVSTLIILSSVLFGLWLVGQTLFAS